MAFDAIKYHNSYNKANYDTIQITVPKGCGKVIKDEAKFRGISVTKYIVHALEECYFLDLSKKIEPSDDSGE